MFRSSHPFRAVFAIFYLAFVLGISGCAKHEEVSAKSFVGKWKSSRLVTPLFLYENGDWEIKNNEGSVLQYGVWQYRNDAIVWSFRKSDTAIGHDVNKVLSVKPNEFQLREGDQSITTFVKID